MDGALDSTDVVRLVVYVEDRYAVPIEDADRVPENFATVRARRAHTKQGVRRVVPGKLHRLRIAAAIAVLCVFRGGNGGVAWASERDHVRRQAIT